MSISSQIAEAMRRGSFIRKMFEEGRQLKQTYGDDNVFDFSIGNPDVPPPRLFQEVLEEEAARQEPMLHCYMPNAGYEKTRAAVADAYATQVDLPFKSDNIIMTSGAGGALNVVLKAILEPDDEVIVLAPFFVEYGFYITNHGGRMVISETTSDFMPNLDDIAGRITSKTRAVLINSPNNPTGVVYSREMLDQLGNLLADFSDRRSRPIYLLSDEPYRTLMFDNRPYPSPLASYNATVIVTSNSKDLSLAGERIGHIAVSPNAPDHQTLTSALVFANRILGFVNANALMQRVVARLQDIHVDPMIYQRRRDLFCRALGDLGFDFVKPSGAFYLFPRSPLPDDSEFADFMRKYRVIVVPGSGFFRAGHFRISFAVKEATIERSIEFFTKAARELGLTR